MGRAPPLRKTRPGIDKARQYHGPRRSRTGRSPSDRLGQPERQLRKQEAKQQGGKLHCYKWNNAAIDITGRDLWRRYAAQKEERPAERRREERCLEIDADQR